MRMQPNQYKLCVRTIHKLEVGEVGYWLFKTLASWQRIVTELGHKQVHYHSAYKTRMRRRPPAIDPRGVVDRIIDAACTNGRMTMTVFDSTVLFKESAAVRSRLKKLLMLQSSWHRTKPQNLEKAQEIIDHINTTFGDIGRFISPANHDV